MAIDASVLRRLAALDLAPNAMSEVLSIIAEIEAPNEERRKRDAERKIRGRSTENPRTIQGTSAENPVPRAGARTETPTTNSSSPPEKEKEERKIPPAADTPPAARGKTLCPEDYQPPERLIDLGRREGLDLPAIFRARDEMVSWSRGNGEKRLDWDAVFANWLRRNAAKARAGPGGQRAGNGTGFNGKATLGDIHDAALAAIAARDGQNASRPSLELLAGPPRRPGNGAGDHRPPDGVPRPAGGPDEDRGGVLLGFGRPRTGAH